MCVGGGGRDLTQDFGVCGGGEGPHTGFRSVGGEGGTSTGGGEGPHTGFRSVWGGEGPHTGFRSVGGEGPHTGFRSVCGEGGTSHRISECVGGGRDLHRISECVGGGTSHRISECVGGEGPHTESRKGKEEQDFLCVCGRGPLDIPQRTSLQREPRMRLSQ